MTKRHTARTVSDLGRSDSMEGLHTAFHSSEQYGEESLSSLRQALLVAILLLSLLFSSLDASIVSTSLVNISLDLKDFLNAPWVAMSYLVAYLGFAVVFAKMSDIYGRRTLIIVSWILFAGSSLGCGLAQDMTTLIIFRAFQGIGGSGLYSLAQIGLFEIGPRNKSGLLAALIGMTLAVSFVLGPVLGGTISTYATWRWIFFINIPCGITALIGLIFAWPRARASLLSHWDTFRSIDFPGNFLIITASSLLVFSLQEAGSSNFSWDSPVIVTTLTVSSLSWVALATWEIYLVRRYTFIQPVFPMRLLTHRVYLGALICTLFTGFTYLAIIIILPERFQMVNGDNPFMAGTHLLPMLGACALGSFLAGALSSRRNLTSITLIMASCLQLVGIGLLLTLSGILTAIQAQYGYQAIFGLGAGLSFGAATILTSVQCPNDLAVAQGAISQARVLGGAIGIAVCMIVFNTQVQEDLGDKITPDDLRALRHNPTIIKWFGLEQKLLVREAYAVAFTDDIKIMVCMCAVGLVASLFTFERHPPAMPARQQRPKEPAVAPSETELDEIHSIR
ncbi:major facilitator superfamily domain-containing protein [Xylariales sp. AK1849]|nr:major facilitator superfamily domain-containing protein [Xylariales sp. AK1849]